MLPLGTTSPDFHLPDVMSGEMISPSTFADKKAFLVMFISRHCPFVQHIKRELSKIGQDYKHKDIGIVAICSNDTVAYPEDSPDSLKEMAQEENFFFPVCFDESQQTAKEYHASCTPDFFLFDKDRHLVYRGQLDNARPGNPLPVTGEDLRRAIEAVLQDTQVNKIQKPSLGCSIKWKEGNEPGTVNSSSRD